MKSKVKKMVWVVSVALLGSLLLSSCGPKKDTEPAGVGERTGAAIDRAAEKTKDTANSVSEKTADAAKKTVKATKDFTGAAVEKTGEVLEKAGAAVEKTGEDMQK